MSDLKPKPKSCIYLVRHGQTQWNIEQRFQGQKNSPLTYRGKQQAYKLAKFVASIPIEAIYCSPLKRAQQTAQIIAQGQSIPLIIENRLSEISLGHWEGKTRAQVQRSHPYQHHNFWQEPDRFVLPGAERFIDLQQRMVAGLEAIFSRHNHQHTLAVSHWMAISTALNYYLGMPSLEHQEFSIDNGSVIILQREENKTHVVVCSDLKAIN